VVFLLIVCIWEWCLCDWSLGTCVCFHSELQVDIRFYAPSLISLWIMYHPILPTSKCNLLPNFGPKCERDCAQHTESMLVEAFIDVLCTTAHMYANAFVIIHGFKNRKQTTIVKIARNFKHLECGIMELQFWWIGFRCCKQSRVRIVSNHV
jgi:hypothetical protein